MFAKKSDRKFNHNSKNPKHRIKSAARAAVENLEGRQLMSVALIGSTLAVYGTGFNDSITVSQNAVGHILVNDNGVTSIHPEFISQVVLNGYQGNDSLQSYDGMTRQLIVYAGPGNDNVRGGGAADYLYGEDGDDNLEGRSGGDFVSGGNGIDVADFGAYFSNLNITLDNAWNDTGAGAGTDNLWSDIENVNGGYGNDSITGSALNNTVSGGGGTDYLYGADGNDVLDGGVGGVAYYSQNTGNDYLSGGNGNDVLHASDYGNNSLRGDYGDDLMFGYAGSDNIDGWYGNDTAYAGAGNDTVWGFYGNDQLHGQDGDDRLNGESDHDLLTGGGGTDVLNGGYGNDTLDGGVGGAYYWDNTGNDQLNGGDGNDLLHASDFGDNNMHGDAGNDTLFGYNGRDNLYGDEGDDHLHGGTNDDGLFGGTGVDALTGGDGDDRFLSRTWEEDFFFFKIRHWEDSISDNQPNDAVLGFQNNAQVTLSFAGQNGSYTFAPGNWTDNEIELMDTAFEVLHDSTFNTRLLKRANQENLIYFRSGAQIASSGGTFSAAAWNSGNSVTFANGTFSTDNFARQVLFHEMGHNWDTEYDAAGWRGLSGWTNANMAGIPGWQMGLDASGSWWHLSSASFVSGYARTNPNEDFAESFAKYFMDRAGWTNGYTAVPAKNTFIANMVTSLI